MISHQPDVKPDVYAYAAPYAAGGAAVGGTATGDLYSTNHDAFSTVLTNQMYSTFPTGSDGVAGSSAAPGGARSPYPNAIYALDPVNHPYAHTLKYHASNAAASYSDLLTPKYAAFDVRWGFVGEREGVERE